MTRAHNVVLSLSLASVLASAACGSDSDTKNDAPPRLIEGGGVGDGSIDGVLSVHVIDSETDAVLAGATVYIGEAGEELLEAETDEDGLAALDSPRLAGPTTITVTVDDYIVTTWFGADGANVTIPMDPVRESNDVDTATVSGTFDDWTSLPAPAENHFYAAVFSYSQTADLGGAENEIEQPTGDPFPPNVCFAAAVPEACNWSVESRTGTVAIHATIIDIDSKGTEDGSDDTQEVLGFAYKLGLELEPDDNKTNVILDTIDGSALVATSLNLPSTPSELDEAGGLLTLETADSGVIVIGFAPDSSTTLSAPALEDDFAGDSYRVLAFAGKSDAEEDSDDEPMSAIILRGLTNLGSQVDIDDFLPAARSLSEDADTETYSFSPVSGASFHGAALIHTRADRFWTIAILDGRTEFVLPEIREDPRPSTSIDMTVDALEGAVDLQDFAIDDLINAIDRFSKARTTL